uniref:Uncharacterized protein n=1 Tax=Anguilla anguilla TaxID=7936 RepID=A0A0E9UGI4_ANGAN
MTQSYILIFPENYACELSSEIQPFHFGGNKLQATIHTAAAYANNGSQSYATISRFIRHNRHAVSNQ